MKNLVVISTFVVVLAGISHSTKAQAQSVDPEQLAACAAIGNSLKRLVCYDEVVTGSGVATVASQGASNSATTGAARAEQASQGRSQRGGKSERADGRNLEEEFGKAVEVERLKRLDVEIASKKQTPRGQWIITLENGQVWKQTDYRKHVLPTEASYFIEAGVSTNFFLGRKGSNSRVSVERIE
ncbi:hypothetical protein SAMN06297229_1946 [Pseudidiomarina planktonica]|uniref:Uncharacterized protein n=1 Tax=Pseudidiomarina planktonica TaxID=1323738 RepID=A0A1Y6G397_9GAMM|nr:hypothetical protein [Pseudidiomarina planktonica]RUO63894.1 hypothetical protein CWI77_09230 [Pseudidiomarina planktonica]SMQ80031.1 hypothetical protein SAMN06297229_1946 [Pseudidiomarina planktonica]